MSASASNVLGTADAGVFLHAPYVGSHALHDPRETREPPRELRARHLLALDVCAGCPCTTSCAALLDSPTLAELRRSAGRTPSEKGNDR